ncbi:hypothetical protein SUGI_1063300 [Cryptomeria japonica]|uniref:protein PHYTOCHROME KINASE SUBSTRATE 4 n=1 Tax=Cryptomeria japonica TaxID=3369 RepID=UPI002414B33B|nr:protein PHYTOCHROME KINASE SUBSTRATE 4 [Cryptomeria japonica]GLJ49993.1 hypothetical protein SUGI_1063300 [Cryptomeria japonica]
MNLIGESMQNNKNVICDGDYRTPLRDVSFSSYAPGSSTKQKSNLKLKGTAAGNQTRQETIQCIEGDDTSEPAFVNGLQKQNSCSNRVPISGRALDSEISIFQAEKYFTDREEKETDVNLESTKESSKPGENSNSKDKIRARNNKVLLSNHELTNSCNLISSPASSIVVVNQCFRPGGSTPSTSSEASWNSRSGLLSRSSRISASRSPTKAGQKYSGMWAFCCKWPCSSRKSVEIEDTLTEFKLASSVPNSLTSHAPLNCPPSSARECYPSPGKKVLGDSDRECLGEQLDRKSNDGFTFPIMSAKSQEEVRQSLGVFGSPFPGTPNREETRNFNPDMAIPQLIQPSDLQGRLVLFNLDKSRKSFTSHSNREIHKLGEIRNEDCDQGMESDSSSDLFEIESASYPLRGDFEDDTSNTQSHNQSTACQLGFPKYFHFGGREDAVTSSAKNCCYESQRTFVSHQRH